jgi:hypothetical protein
VLSHHDTREIIVVHRGSRFARQILQVQHAHEFGSPPRFRRCAQGPVELKRSRRRGGRLAGGPSGCGPAPCPPAGRPWPVGV